MKLKAKRWEIILGVFLVLLTVILYVMHYLIFHDIHHIMIYFLGDLAFLPLEVLLVAIIVHRLLASREKKMKMDKLGVVINTFFSEVGVELLKKLSSFCNNSELVKNSLLKVSDSTRKDFLTLIKKIKQQDYSFNSQRGDIENLKDFLIKKRDFLLMLLENPMILEHDQFTNLLWSIMHLEEEVFYRKDLKNLYKKDYEHLSGDIKRVYTLLIQEYIIYLMNLKNKYPYLFSLATRINPFNPQAKVEIS